MLELTEEQAEEHNPGAQGWRYAEAPSLRNFPEITHREMVLTRDFFFRDEDRLVIEWTGMFDIKWAALNGRSIEPLTWESLTAAIAMEKQFTVTVPGKFADWFAGTNLVAGGDDSDPECKETRIAWESRATRRRGKGVSHTVTGSRTVLKVLHEYGVYCVEANKDEEQPAELAAALEVIKRVNKQLSQAR